MGATGRRLHEIGQGAPSPAPVATDQKPPARPQTREGFDDQRLEVALHRPEPPPRRRRRRRIEHDAVEAGIPGQAGEITPAVVAHRRVTPGIDAKIGIEREVIAEPGEVGAGKIDADHPVRAPRQQGHAERAGVGKEVQPIPARPGQRRQARAVFALIEEESHPRPGPHGIPQARIHLEAKPALVHPEPPPAIEGLGQPGRIRGRAPGHPGTRRTLRRGQVEDFDDLPRPARPGRRPHGFHHRAHQIRAGPAGDQNPEHIPKAIHVKPRQPVGFAMNQPQGIGVGSAIHHAARRPAPRRAPAMREGPLHPERHFVRVVQNPRSRARPHPRRDWPPALHPGDAQALVPGSHHLDPGARRPIRGIVALLIGQDPRVPLAQHPGRGPRDVINACRGGRHDDEHTRAPRHIDAGGCQKSQGRPGSRRVDSPAMRATQALFQAIQEAASRSMWSRGVELVRAEAVSGESAEDEEIVLRISTRQGLKAPVVTLYPQDEDWECTCNGEEDPCEHVTAAIIALRKARKEGQPLPQAAARTGRLRYRFESQDRNSLSLVREVVIGDKVLPLEHSLTALAAGRVRGPRFDADNRDMSVERILGIHRAPVLPREAMAQLLDALAGSSRVVLDGEPIAVSSEHVLPVARVVDAPGGVRLFLEQDPSVTRTFGSGVVLAGDTLRALGDPKLDGREREQLPRGQFFSNDQLGELVSEVLPGLEARIPLDIQTDRLPATRRGDPPRIQLTTRREGDQLALLPTLVYGNPPTARVDAGRLVHIEGPLPLRDLDAERSETVGLERGLGLKPGRRILFSGTEAIAFAERLATWRGDVVGDAHLAFYSAPELVPALRVEGKGFDVGFSLPEDSDGGRPARSAAASAESVIGAWRRGESMVALDGGGFAPLPSDWLARFGHRVADLLAARDDRGEVPACVLPDLGQLCEDLDTPAPPQLDRLRPLLEDFSGIPPAPLPGDLRAELREYQRQGVDWLHFLREAGLGALLADDMGLGKTLQTLCALEKRSLVVVPTSLIYNWGEEIKRFRPGLRVSVYHGARRALDAEADVVLTSYAILRLDTDVLAAENWRTLVLDEAQNIKNPESQVARAAQGLEAEFRIALTGTPVENRLEELWSQLHFLNRGLLGGRKDFQDRYARPIAEGDETAAERLRSRVRPFVLRRLKRDVAPELPPRSEVVLHCELSREERDVYDTVRAASLSRVVEDLRAGGNMMEALEALLRLRQAACHPGLVPGQEAERSTKVDLLVERLSQAFEEGHKALVFSQWTSLLDRVEPALAAAGIDFERLDGSTRDRPGVIRRFDAAEGASVMLISLRAGGTGLNLTSADHVFLLDPWWNPAVEDQAADRAHRIGQTRPVVVHRLVALETVEERILELHARKRALAEAVLGAGGSGSGLSRDDLLSLLEG